MYCYLTEEILQYSSESEGDDDPSTVAGMRVLRQEGVSEVLREGYDCDLLTVNIRSRSAKDHNQL